VLCRAFPVEVRTAARKALRRLPPAELRPIDFLPTSNKRRHPPPRVLGARVLIPYRIHHPPVDLAEVPPDALPFVAAVYTRHHDGRVRQAATADESARADLQVFAATNPGFIALTRAKAVSYWDEHYRGDFDLRSYPPLLALREITGTWR
jgi:hypothetical protein